MLAPLLQTVLFIALVPATVVGWLPWAILRALDAAQLPPFGAPQLVALALALGGAAVALPCMADFAITGRGTPAPIAPPKTLIVRGLYRRTRNPMYVGIVAILTAEALFFGALALVGYAAAVTAMFQAFIVLYEEPTLRRTFGASYDAYCGDVPRWLVRVR